MQTEIDQNIQPSAFSNLMYILFNKASTSLLFKEYRQYTVLCFNFIMETRILMSSIDGDGVWV